MPTVRPPEWKMEPATSPFWASLTIQNLSFLLDWLDAWTWIPLPSNLGPLAKNKRSLIFYLSHFLLCHERSWILLLVIQKIRKIMKRKTKMRVQLALITAQSPWEAIPLICKKLRARMSIWRWWTKAHRPLLWNFLKKQIWKPPLPIGFSKTRESVLILQRRLFSA